VFDLRFRRKLLYANLIGNKKIHFCVLTKDQGIKDEVEKLSKRLDSVEQKVDKRGDLGYNHLDLVVATTSCCNESWPEVAGRHTVPF
jgi:hypothetical protein